MTIESFFSPLLSFSYFIIVLGLAVVFHEWGHFIVAKGVGAKVDRFAVGFGRAIMTYTWRGTEYALCLLPLGGYVKIRGMDPEDEISGAEWEYLQLAPWKRIAIVIAGPFMNFVLAYLIYVLLFVAWGESYTQTTQIGHVPKGSWGWEMGLRDDDQIVSVNGNSIDSWDGVLNHVNQVNDSQITVTIERGGETIEKSKTIPSGYQNTNVPVTPPADYEGLFVTGVLPGGAAEEAGLEAGMVIEEIDGKQFENTSGWSDYISSRYQKSDGEYEAIPVTLEIAHPDSATDEITVTPDLKFPADDAVPSEPVAFLGFTYQGDPSVMEYLINSQIPIAGMLGVGPKLAPIIGTVQDGSAAQEAGLTSGSRIIEIDGQPIEDWVDLLKAVQATLTETDAGEVTAQPIEVTWLNPDQQMQSATIAPNVIEQPILTRSSMRSGEEHPIAQLGVDRKSDRRYLGIVAAAGEAWNRLVFITGFMIDFIADLFTGAVSPKLLGGPIAIYQMSDESGRWGMERLLGFVAMLSANLGLINLFPLPPLDGGHLIFYFYEMIRRKPITMKQMESFGKIGFALIIPLFLFLIFNDLARVNFFSWVASLFGIS